MATNPATPKQRLDRISENAMCIGCGLCQSIAGVQTVHMQVMEHGAERPVVVGDLTHEVVDRIYDTCPGTRVEGLPAAEVIDSSQTDLVWGVYQSMSLAHAADPAVRHRGSTGGVLSALGMFLMDTGEVDFILHAKQHSTEASFGERQVSNNAQEVLESAGSRYGPTAPLIDVLDQLDKGRPFAFVGKPCDIAALRNLALFDVRVNALVKYMLTPVCGGFMAPKAMERMMRENFQVNPESVKTLRYRGYGCPGPTEMKLSDGSTVERTYTDFWGTDESMWQLPFRCKVCSDGIGEAADIAASDTWPGGSPNPEDDETLDLGTNAIVVRTSRGQDLVNRAVAAGYLTLPQAVDPRYMDTVQPHQRNKKLSVGARHEGMRAAGHIAPRTARLRLDALMDELGAERAAEERDGTQKRVLDGKATECTPTNN